MESMDVEEAEADNDSMDASTAVQTIVSGIIAAKSLNKLKKSFDYGTDLLKEKQLFFELKGLYHLFCVITETAFDERRLHPIGDNVMAFYRKTSDVCFEWKCLSDHFESDYQFYNAIQVTLKSIIDKLNDNNIDNEFVNRCLPLMLTSMMTIVSTIHGLKELVVISRSITTEIIMKRKTNGLCVGSEEWKRLITCLTFVCNLWQRVIDIEGKDGHKLSQFVVLIVDYMLSKDEFFSHISDKVIKYISQLKNISLNQLFIEYQVEISSHILRILIINSDFNELENILQKTMSLFAINSLPRELLKHIIPYFALKCDSNTKLFIEELSKISEKSTKEVIKLYLTDIICYLFFTKTFEKSVQNIKHCIEFLSRFSNSDISYRIEYISNDLFNSCLMNWSEDRNSTLEAIAFTQYYRLFRKDPTKDLDLNLYHNNETQLKSDLNAFFLPFVHKFDSLIQNISISSPEKIKAINSLIQLIAFVDKQCVNTFRVKIFSTIKLILSERFYSNKQLLKLSIEALMQFIKTVDDVYLSSELLTISALLLPLIHFWPNETSNVFKEIILKHHSNPLFMREFKHLYFIPECNELLEVTKVLKPYIAYDVTDEDVCLKRIRLVVDNISHENSRVQEFSLRELLELLTRHQSLIYRKCNNIKEFECDLFVNQIVNQLMSCLMSTNKDVLQLVAECLGVLGAIDALRIDMEKPITSREASNPMFLNANEKDFKMNLIKLLYKSMTNTFKIDDQYCASYALQELIKLYTSEDAFIIDGLPQEMKGYCNLLKKTRYQNNHHLSDEEMTTEPIFGSDPNLTYTEWLNKWVKSLFCSFIFIEEKAIGYSEGADLLSQSSHGQYASQRSDMFESDLAKALNNYSIKSQVLKVCYFTIIRDTFVAQFLLPYIVITALKNATLDQKQVIVNEVKTVITKLTTDESIFFGQSGHLSSQTVFGIYDYLKIWYKNRISLHKKVCTTARQLKTAKLKDKEFKGVHYFLENISTHNLSVLAFKCNAFSRSLRYIEEYVKSEETAFQREIPFLQKIFIRLDDPDSVDGCNFKRTGNPDIPISQQILTHEAMGKIQEALICSAKTVQLNSDSFESIEKYLQISMDSFDQSNMVSTYGFGLMIKRPEWRPKLAPYVIEAVWKLGDWMQLNELIEQHYNDLTTFGSKIGSLFCAIINKKDLCEVESIVSALRSGLVGPLSAAAMEISGYVRGHKYIVDLHVLYDIQLVYNKLIAELDEDVCSIDSLKNKFSAIVDTLNQRNNLIRKTVECQEPILNAQRALLSILDKRSNDANERLGPLSVDINKQLFQSWLMSTKTSRKSGNIQRSYNCLLEMNKLREKLDISYGNEIMSTISSLSDLDKCEAILENSKVLWFKDHKIEAIQYLKKQIDQNYSYSYGQCIQTATQNLKHISSDDLIGIRNSLSLNSAPVHQSSNVVSMNSTGGSDSSPDDSPHESFAKLQLLYTKYCDELGILNQNSLAILYKSVTIAASEWEESHYNLGMYCHKIYTNYEESNKKSKGMERPYTYSLGKPDEILDLKGRAVKSLVQSLKYGVKHAHNSLPLLFNIWLDLGTEYNFLNNRSKNAMSSQHADKEEIRQMVEKINNSLNDLLANAPLFIFFMSFAQMTARVLHPFHSINVILKKILIRLIIEFPQQSMWLIMRSFNSQHQIRKNCFKDIVTKALLQDQRSHLQKYVTDMIDFSKLLAEMCQKKDFSVTKGQRIKQLSLRKEFPQLHRMFEKNTSFGPILLPFQSLVNVTLPKSMHEKNYNPFPTRDIFIERFDDCIELLASLQRPKKISIYGSDGKMYTILCKPGDDLRKDYCFIEFSNLLNRCFKRDSESRRRQLSVKTYLVVSLTDSSGLIEWVPGLIPYRTVVESQYRLVKDYDALKDTVIRGYPTHTLNKEERVRRFQNDILPQFKPSVFSNWFATTYTDPLSWFAARQAYTRSTAIFSIIGYLLGLGDRHGENIMIEEISGQTVHVDLNCMFNKGEDFTVPERVPFRLTHNMVNAMGVTEFEGTFRKACEHALRVARHNKEALMNFITPFRFDHLVEWSRNNSDIKHNSSETLIETAERIVFNIEARLKGIPSRNERNLPKGGVECVEGQVKQIIEEATDGNNLGVMYVGWTAYL